MATPVTWSGKTVSLVRRSLSLIALLSTTLIFWQQIALNFKVFKSIKLQSSSSSSPVRNSDSFLANLLILFVKILILFYHSECVRRVGLNKKIGWLPSCPLTLWDYRWPGLRSVGNESIWMVIEKSESIASEMKAQAIAEIYWQYRLLPGQSIILAFLAPLTLFLVVTSQIWPPPSLSEKLFFKSVYFCFYVLRVVNSSPNARSWLRPEKWSKWHRNWYWYTNSNTDTGKDQFLDPSGYSLYWCFLFNLFHEKFFGDFFGHFSEHCKFLILVW